MGPQHHGLPKPRNLSIDGAIIAINRGAIMNAVLLLTAPVIARELTNRHCRHKKAIPSHLSLDTLLAVGQ